MKDPAYKIYLALLMSFCLHNSSYSQQVNLININELNTRIDNGKDSTFIINFWATWCAPCLKELPIFEKFAQEHKDEKVKILLVSVDFISMQNTVVLKFIKKQKIKNEVFLLNETNQDVYINRVNENWSGSIPATLFRKKGIQKFVEKELTYTELINEYKTTLSL